MKCQFNANRKVREHLLVFGLIESLKSSAVRLKCGPWTDTIIWELIKNANSQAPPRHTEWDTLGVGFSNLCSTSLLGDCVRAIASHCPSQKRGVILDSSHSLPPHTQPSLSISPQNMLVKFLSSRSLSDPRRPHLLPGLL